MMSRSAPLFRSSRGNSDAPTVANSHRRGSSSASPSTYPPPPPEAVHRSQSSTATPHVSSRGIQRFEQRRTMEQSQFLASKARAHNLNPPIDLRLLDYVIPSDENLSCPICRCPFVDPMVLTECDHCFCRDCIRQTWTTSTTPYSPLGPRGDCPTCRTPAKLGPRSATSKILVNILDDLVVKCPKSEYGCPATVKRGEVQDHVNIYCGFARVECSAETCELPVLRREAGQGCLHYGVSCMACHEEMQKSQLETHWRNSCLDRQVTCDLCHSDVFYRDLEEHNSQSCPAISVTCPGKLLGCTNKSKRSQADVHAKTCTFARLAPVLSAQKQRMDEQEAAQKAMSRKLEVLEDGFSAMQGMLYPPTATEGLEDGEPLFEDAHLSSDDALRTPARAAPPPPALDFPMPDHNDGPYTSPHHHLLSLHESLRAELSRTQTLLTALDARQSLQILNENLRTREEVTYLGAQVAGLQRQVHWVTSAQLQRQQQQQQGQGQSRDGGEAVGEAVREAVRVVGGAGIGMVRRAGSEEGRTKL